MKALETQNLPEEEASPVRHGLATFLAFVVAGALPLTPYVIPVLDIDRFMLSTAFTLLALFAVGASRALIAQVRWWRAGSRCWHSGLWLPAWLTGAAPSCRQCSLVSDITVRRSQAGAVVSRALGLLAQPPFDNAADQTPEQTVEDVRS